MGFKAKLFGRRDFNHNEIANALRASGYSVGETSGSASFVDLVCSSNDFTCLLEVKTDEGGIYLSQLLTVGSWRGAVAFVTTATEALEVMRFRKVLTPAQKEKILQFYYRKKTLLQSKNPKVSVAHFNREMGWAKLESDIINL